MHKSFYNIKLTPLMNLDENLIHLPLKRAVTPFEQIKRNNRLHLLPIEEKVGQRSGRSKSKNSVTDFNYDIPTTMSRDATASPVLRRRNTLDPISRPQCHIQKIKPFEIPLQDLNLQDISEEKRNELNKLKKQTDKGNKTARAKFTNLKSELYFEKLKKDFEKYKHLAKESRQHDLKQSFIKEGFVKHTEPQVESTQIVENVNQIKIPKLKLSNDIMQQFLKKKKKRNLSQKEDKHPIYGLKLNQINDNNVQKLKIMIEKKETKLQRQLSKYQKQREALNTIMLTQRETTNNNKSTINLIDLNKTASKLPPIKERQLLTSRIQF